ncbi:MAG: hypothetical protein KTR22_09550 [Flavobacteriaceae bacterium]|nr:hypothetical protein [Flavobacteriaceae bacterium]
MKNWKPILVILAFMTCCFISCSTDDGSDEEPTNETSEGINVYTNAADPLLVEFIDAESNKIQYYGTRDAEGRPTGIERMVVATDDGKEQTYLYDSAGRPSYIYADNGTQFDLEWLDNETIALTVFTADGLNQINTIVDVNNPAPLQTNETNRVQQRTGRAQLNYKSIAGTTQGETSFSNGQNVFLNTYECFEKADVNNPYFIVQDEDGAFLRTISAQRIATGEYGATIPNDLAPSIDGQEICEGLGEFVVFACDLPPLPDGVLTAMCVTISSAIILTGIGAAAGAAILAACEEIVLAYELACAIVQIYGDLGAGEAICNANFINQTWTDDLIITGVVNALPTNFRSDPVVAPGLGPYPTIELDLGDETAVKSFFITPSAPASGQDYDAIARISCLRPGMVVEVSVVGTDGYTDSISYNITQTDALGEFTLNVPGADTGIQDTCTVNVYLELGGTLTRTASIVFGN